MAGFVIGNPLILSPIYNNYLGSAGNLSPQHNRIKVHHIGMMGAPANGWSWRVMYTHQYSLGTYVQPLKEPGYANYLLLEATYKPKWGGGLSFSAAYGHNDGTLLGKSNAAMLTIGFGGWLNRTQW